MNDHPQLQEAVVAAASIEDSLLGDIENIPSAKDRNNALKAGQELYTELIEQRKDLGMQDQEYDEAFEKFTALNESFKTARAHNDASDKEAKKKQKIIDLLIF